jgi:hypothetical protein
VGCPQEVVKKRGQTISPTSEENMLKPPLIGASRRPFADIFGGDSAEFTSLGNAPISHMEQTFPFSAENIPRFPAEIRGVLHPRLVTCCLREENRVTPLITPSPPPVTARI